MDSTRKEAVIISTRVALTNTGRRSLRGIYNTAFRPCAHIEGSTSGQEIVFY